MSNLSELRAAVKEVESMTPREIAKMLEGKKILGRPKTTYRCPLAMLMKLKHGGEFVVGQRYVMRRIPGEGAGEGKVDRVKTPPNLVAFVQLFDKGEFPKLIGPAPVCKPRTEKSWDGSGPPGKRRLPRGPVQFRLARDVGRNG